MKVLYRLKTAAIATSVAMCAVSAGIGQAYAQSTPTSVRQKPTRRRASRSSTTPLTQRSRTATPAARSRARLARSH